MKRVIALGIMGAFVMSMMGCTAPVDATEKSKTESEVQISIEEDQEAHNQNEKSDELAVGDIITIGKIIEFRGDTIHITSGDIVEIFEYDENNTENYYLGQTVQLIKGEKGNYLTEFIKADDDYTIRHSNMGNPINQIPGQLIKVNDKSIVVSNGNDEFLIETYETVEAELGSHLTVYAMNFGEKTSAIMVLNEDNKLNLTITEINRDDQGSMILLLKDANDGQYTINVSASTIELNMSELSVGDELTVYHNGIMESYPMQLDTVLIRK
jgi:hypothetical protein